MGDFNFNSTKDSTTDTFIKHIAYVCVPSVLTDISFVYQIIIIYIHKNVNGTSKILLLQRNQLLHALKFLH